MIDCPTVSKNVIRGHYDLSTLFYRLLWGQHIHHGLWEDAACRESPRVAQLNLTKTLAAEAGIQPGKRVLDVGCGMGGSSIYLADKLDCDVTGVTISPFQRRWAANSARWQGVSGKTKFVCADAEKIEFPPESFDVVWSIECTEHLFDKPQFFAKAAQWLRPGGHVVICAWLAGDAPQSDQDVQQVYDVCEGFFCPSLGTSQDYQQWMTQAGLEFKRYHDWTERVAKTWEICDRRVKRTGVRWLARVIDKGSVVFLDRFNTILQAYRTGAMRYGCFVARKH